MKKQPDNPSSGVAVAEQLRDLGVRGILIVAAEGGRIEELACAMPECLCPEELGGRGYFERVHPSLPDWMPTVDHYPILKEQGGYRTIDNVRLAHRLCNRVDYSKRIGRLHARDLARVEAARTKRTGNPNKPVWSVLVWNMGLGSPPRRDPARTWQRLEEFMREHSVDIALLNEASIGGLANMERALYSADGTKGRDTKPRPWSTAIVSRHGVEQIDHAQAHSYRSRKPKVPFETSRAGSWSAGLVRVPEAGAITCVALYGLTDELSEASVHRSLTEVSPLFSDPSFKEQLLLGGDLNTSTQWPPGAHLDGDQALLDRIEAYGLIDCLEAKWQSPPENCPCQLDACTHTLTRLDPGDPKHTAWQMDYLFASRALADRLETCVALPPTDWQEYSDHAPLLATFRVA